MSESLPNTVLALGANLNLRGNEPKVTLQKALGSFERHGVMIRTTSRFFATPCFPIGAGPDYVNAAVSVETSKSPADLLATLHDIESAFGREREQRWGMRTLDLDLICYGDFVRPDRHVFDHWRGLPQKAQRERAPEQLILPHPRLQDRAFVLVPMADVAPDWRHPVLGLTVTQMLARLAAEEVASVVPL